MKKTSLIITAILIVFNCLQAQEFQLKTFDLSAVRLLDGPFFKAQQADMKYMLELDADRLLAPYLIDAGIEPKAERYGNWENIGLDGHTCGHYLSALSLMYASTGNNKLSEKLNYTIDQLAICQEKNGNGYVGGIPEGKKLWKDIEKGNIDAGGFSLANRWVPLYNIHKLYAGLRDAYLLTGNKKALDILVKLTNWWMDLTKNLSDDQVQQILKTEHGGINEVFADVSVITGDKKYLDLAKRFSHRAILDPLIKKENKLTGLHANTQIPKVVGFERIGEISGDKEWSDAAMFFWNTVVDKWTVSIGGNSVREHFHSHTDFSSMTESNQGPETCNTYNMLRLTRLLFLSNPAPKYMDYYERALFNHILSSEHPEKGGFVYFTPMRPRHYRVYSQPQECFWCCVGTGLENHAKYGELIYAHNEKDVFVNLFIASTLEWKEKRIALRQETDFPFKEISQIKIKLDKPEEFAVNIRYPEWIKGDNSFKILVNGKETKVEKKSIYASVQRKWKSGDVISVTLPMKTRVEYMPDGSSWASVVHGPVVLAAATDTTDLQGLWADGSRMGHAANGPLYPVENAPVIITSAKDFSSSVSPVKGKVLTFSMAGLVYPDEYKAIELVPFFTVHEKRYMIYFPVTDSFTLKKKLEDIRKNEELTLALEAITIDQVSPGEQQPEVEHNFKGEMTESGMHEGKHWRHSRKWFSYDLKDVNKEAKKLRITYFGLDKGRTFDILINGKILSTVKLDGSNGNKFFDVDYSIPQDLIDLNTNGLMNLKFAAHENSMAGGIYYIRLLKE